MKKIILLVAVIVLLLTGCGQVKEKSVANEGMLEKDWTAIEDAARGTDVRIFMWGGDEGINRYMDEWVAPRLKEQYNINLIRTPMNIGDVLQKLTTEKMAGSNQGSIEIIWLNGENFKNAKTKGLLANPFVHKLPSFQNHIDGNGLDVQYDFGEPTEGLEAPWGKVQFVYLYDSAKVADPPRNFTELKEWVKANPGKFTYPDAEDFTGNAFLRHLLYETVGVENLLDRGYDEVYVSQQAGAMWEYLNEIKPYLWRQGETYPQSLTHLDQLFSQGEVWLSMGYNEARAESLIRQGTLPQTIRSFVMDTGSIGNTHFLSIPFNTPNLAGAMVAINFLLSPDAQLAKMDPVNWGENTVLDPAKLSGEYQDKLATINRGSSVLPAAELQKVLLPEISAEYVTWIKEKWMSEVVQSSAR